MLWVIADQVLLFLESFLFLEYVTRYNGIDWTARQSRIAFWVTLFLSYGIVLITDVRIESSQARLLVRTAILFIYALYFLEGNLTGKSLSCLFFPFILLLAQAFSGILVSIFAKDVSLQEIFEVPDSYHLIYRLISLVITFYCTRIFLRFRSSYRHPYRRIHMLLSVTIPLITLLFAGLLTELMMQEVLEPAAMILLVLSMTGVLIINLVIYYLLSSIGNEGDLAMENDMLRRFLQYEQRSMDEQKMIYEQIRKVRHELKNSLNLVEQQIRSGQTEEAIEFIENYRGQIQRTQTIIQTDNETLNFVVNTQLARAASLEVTPKIQIEETILPFSDIDLHSLLGNMVSNALDALEKEAPADRDMALSIRREGGYIRLEVRNKISESILEKNPHLITSKPELQQHGFGVRIIRQIAEKYQGMVDFYEENGYFCVQVLVPGTDEKREEFD